MLVYQRVIISNKKSTMDKKRNVYLASTTAFRAKNIKKKHTTPQHVYCFTTTPLVI
jgi:hypothetical protein